MKDEPCSSSLTCLSSHYNSPCLILTLPDICVMLDCSLNFQNLLLFAPFTLLDDEKANALIHRNLESIVLPDGRTIESLKTHCKNKQQVVLTSAVEVSPPDFSDIDFEKIDYILVSNYKNMSALPYVTEHTSFKGIIYATDPALQFGRLLLQEMIQAIDSVPKPDFSSEWKIPEILEQFPALNSLHTANWKKLYTLDELESCLQKIKVVSFREILDLNGYLKAIPISSGYCIGSSNWVLETDYEKIVYITNSSTLTTHTKPMDLASMKQADILIFSNLCQTPLQNPDAMMDEFCRSIINTVKIGGNVLVPCYPIGLIFDLIECLCVQLDQVGLTLVPIYLLGPSVESSMAYANIYSEWLSESKQSKVYIPEEPFLHGYLIRNERIKIFPSCYHGSFSADFRTPCVVFASHSSLRFGDTVHFMQTWGQDSKNLLVITEPDFATSEVLAPYQPLNMRVAICPIDTSLNIGLVTQICNQIRPKLAFTPEQNNSSRQKDHSAINSSGKTIFYGKGQKLALPLCDTFRKMTVDSRLAATAELKHVDATLSVGPLAGDVVSNYNRLELKEAENNEKWIEKLTPCGRLKISVFEDELKKAGFEPTLDEQSEVTCIRLDREKINVELRVGTTNVILDDCSTIDSKTAAADQERCRKKICEILLFCMDKV